MLIVGGFGKRKCSISPGFYYPAFKHFKYENSSPELVCAAPKPPELIFSTPKLKNKRIASILANSPLSPVKHDIGPKKYMN